MNTKNLLPAKYRQLRKRQRSIRRWVLLNSIYAVVLIAVAIFCASSSDHAPDMETLQSTRSDLDKSNLMLASLRQRSAALKADLQLDSQLSQSPDWSILLATLSRNLGDEIYLNRLDCLADPAAAGSAAVSSTKLPDVLRISGIGRSQQSVTQFVLRLEDVHFFARVRLVQTAPLTTGGFDAVEFDLMCDLPAAGGQP